MSRRDVWNGKEGLTFVAGALLERQQTSVDISAMINVAVNVAESEIN